MGYTDMLYLTLQDSEETIADYLRKLLITLIKEKQDFNSKRPFGNSDWVYDLYYPLIENNFISGKIVDGYIEEVDTEKADQLIINFIEGIFV